MGEPAQAFVKESCSSSVPVSATEDGKRRRLGDVVVREGDLERAGDEDGVVGAPQLEGISTSRVTQCSVRLPPDGDFAAGVTAARLVGELMTELGLRAYPKTSGADGMHVFVPIERRHTFEETHAFAEAAAVLLEARHPGAVTTEWLKAKRSGVLIDYNQNGRGRTTASVYSVRPTPGATVSTPLRWEEVRDGLDRQAFTMETLLRRIEEHGDLFAPVLAGGQSLDEPMRPLRELSSLAPRDLPAGQ